MATSTSGTQALTTGWRARRSTPKGWIKCFHAYQSLGPPETHWSLEKFQKYSEEDFVKDVFEDGYVDVALFNPTYLKEWYREGFNTTERNFRMVEKYPDRLIANGRWDPRDGDAGLRRLEEDAERYGLKGVKLYTAEWKNGSRGWSLKAPGGAPFLEKCQELGIINIHVHKGPTIWPLDKDAFDVADVDVAATSYPDLNFIVEHVGLPRIEDFCFMATQEPNVYAGLAVVDRRAHPRPAALLCEGDGRAPVLGGRGQDALRKRLRDLGAQWQIEGLVDWDYPDEDFSDYPPFTTESKKKILGLNAAALYGVEVPAEFRLPEGAGTPAAREDAELVEGSA